MTTEEIRFAEKFLSWMRGRYDLPPHWPGCHPDAATVYETDARGHDHAPAGTRGGGRFVGKGEGGGSVDRAKSEGGRAAGPKKSRASGRAVGGRTADPARVTPNRTAARSRPVKKAVKGIGRVVDVARSRRIKAAHKREKELADAIGGYNLLDSEPADVAYMPEVDGAGKLTGKPLKMDQRSVRQILAGRAKMVERMKNPDTTPADQEGIRRLLEETQPLTFFEVKTLLKSKRDEVRINADALAKKEKWQDKYHARFHVVIVDDRIGRKHSGHRVHVQPTDEGLAPKHTLARSRKANDMAHVLKLATEA